MCSVCQSLLSHRLLKCHLSLFSPADLWPPCSGSWVKLMAGRQKQSVSESTGQLLLIINVLIYPCVGVNQFWWLIFLFTHMRFMNMLCMVLMFFLSVVDNMTIHYPHAGVKLENKPSIKVDRLPFNLLLTSSSSFFHSLSPSGLSPHFCRRRKPVPKRRRSQFPLNQRTNPKRSRPKNHLQLRRRRAKPITGHQQEKE